MSRTDPIPDPASTTVPAAATTAPAPTVWRTGGALFVAQVLSGGLGAVAWLVAARTHSAASVGTALALVGALTWAGLVGNLGLGSLLIGLLPRARRSEQATIAGVGVATAATVGAALGLVVAVALRFFGGGLAATVAQPGVIGALVIGGAAWSSGVVLDHVAVARARPRLTVSRAAISGVGRLVLIGLTLGLGWRNAPALVIGWSAALALGTVVEAAALWSNHQLSFSRRVASVTAVPLALRGIRTHYGVNVLGQTPPMALPVLLAVAGRPVQAAAFGAAWQIASIVGLLSPAVATGVFAAGSADRHRGDRHRSARTATTTQRQVLAIVLTASTALFVLAPWLLAWIGTDYAAVGTTALRILAVGLVADAFSNIEVAHLRLSERYRGAMAINGTILVATLVLAIALVPTWGASGAALGWLAGELLGAAVAVASIRLTATREAHHEDLARLRITPDGPGERGRRAHAQPRRRPALHGPRRRGAAWHRRRPADGSGAWIGPAAPFGGAGPGGDEAA